MGRQVRHMDSDFRRALESLLEPGHVPNVPELMALSGPSREEADLFCELVHGAAEEGRRALLEYMVRAAEESFELDYADLLRCFLDDADAVIRRLAVEGLWEDDQPDMVRPMVRLVRRDPDVQVRAAAAVSLGRFLFLALCEELSEEQGRQIEGALRAVIENADEDIEVRRRALESIAFINEQWVQRLIDRAYDHDDPRMRLSAVFAMGRSAEPLWAETVLAELHSETADMRCEAARASGELELRRAVDPLIRLLVDPDAKVQEMAIWALGQVGGQKARRALEACVAEGNEAMAAAASEALDETEFSVRPMDLMVHDADEALLEDYGEDDDLDAFGDDEDEEDYGPDDDALDVD